MTCWCWSSFWIGVAATLSVVFAPSLVILVGCILAAPHLDDEGNLIVKVQNGG